MLEKDLHLFCVLKNRRLNKRKSLVLLLLILLGLDLAAQKQITNQSLYWIRYYNQLSITKKIVWHNEVDERLFFEKNQQQQFILHTRLHYKFAQNAEVAAGFTYSMQSPQDPKSTSDLVIPELRPVQELSYTTPATKRLSIQQRIRAEQRFIHKSQGVNLVDGYQFNFRFRYRLQASYKLSKEDAKYPTTAKVSNELMVNARKAIVYNQFDQNRVYLGLEKGISKNLSVELGYLHLYQQRATGNQFYNREIVRGTIYHKIKL